MLSLYLSMVDSNEEKEKITQIYEKFYPYMAYKAGVILKSEQDVEDIVHDSMMSIIDNLSLINMDDEMHARNICGVIAKNKALDFLKRKQNQTLSIEESITEDNFVTSGPSEVVIGQDTYDIIVKAIDSLKDTYRDVCLLKYVNGLTEREIAKVMNLSDKTVNQRIFRGKQILREALKRENIYV